MRTDTDLLHGYFCKDCAIGNGTIFGWYNDHGIVKIRVKPYAIVGRDVWV